MSFLKLTVSITIITLLCACSDINNSWEEVGGGYVKYQVNDGSSRTIGLDPDDVRTPSYFAHYISLETNEDSSSIGDRLSFLVADPKLGKNSVDAGHTWFVHEWGAKMPAITDSSVITLDQRDDSTWTGFLNLYFFKCSSGGGCSEDSVLNVTGRFRYWPDPDDD